MLVGILGIPVGILAETSHSCQWNHRSTARRRLAAVLLESLLELCCLLAGPLLQCLLESLLDACRFAWQLLAERLLDTTLKVWWFGRKLFLWNASRALVMLVGARVECLQNLVTCMF